MSADAWLTLVVLLAAVVVMVVDRFPVVLVMGVGGGRMLTFADVIDEATALSGFASSAPRRSPRSTSSPAPPPRPERSVG